MLELFREIPMLSIKNDFLLFIFLSHMLSVNSIAASNEILASSQSNYSSIHIGAVLDLNSPMGTMIDICMSMALEDFYSIHSYYETRLFLHTKNAEEELDVASAGDIHGLS